MNGYGPITFAPYVQSSFSGSNTDGSFTMPVSISSLNPL